MYHFILENIILRFGDLFLGNSYVKYLKFWRKTDEFTIKQIEALQKKNLKRVLKLANRKLLPYSKINLKGENPYDWIKQFPILTKDYLRNNIDLLLTEKKENLIKLSTSGSSGIRTDIYMNKGDLSSFRAGNTRWWEWSGYKIGDRIVQTGMTTKRSVEKRVKDILFKTIYVDAFSLSNEDMFDLFNKIKSKEVFILGYASSLNVLAEFALINNIKLKVKGIISLGDKLFSHYRKNLKQAFNINTIETYGTSEGLLIACQYDLDYLYINSPQVYLEILDENDNPVKDGEIGHVVVTRLDNSAMPLIRYKIGDLAIKLPVEEYPKKRKLNYPLLKKVIGRDTDIVILPDNRKLIVHSFTGIFEYINEIKQFKIVQKNRKGIEILYIKDFGFSNKTLELVNEKLRNIINDNNFLIEFKEVKEILPTKSGKPQIIESLLKK